MVFSRFSSMPANIGQPNFARMIQRMMKAMSMGMNSAMSGRMAEIPPSCSASAANASAGKAALRARAPKATFATALFALVFTCNSSFQPYNGYDNRLKTRTRG